MRNGGVFLIPHYSLLIHHFLWYYFMVKLTKLDGNGYYVNPHQIECIEINPDTTLVMLSGRHHIVREEADDVLMQIEAYRKRLCPCVVQE